MVNREKKHFMCLGSILLALRTKMSHFQITNQLNLSQRSGCQGFTKERGKFKNDTVEPNPVFVNLIPTIPSTCCQGHVFKENFDKSLN